MQNCPYCSASLPTNSHFCPMCGKELIVSSLSLSKQIAIYLVSILLPPLGLLPGIRYMRKTNTQVRVVGIVAIILTILSSVITIWLTVKIMEQVTGNINSQLKQVQDLQIQ